MRTLSIFDTNMKTKNTYIVLASLLLIWSGHAQEGQITIEKDSKIDQLVEVYKKVNSKEGYYQIQVGFKTNDVAAQRLYDQVKIDFPGWHSEIKFKSPTYRIRLGKFKTKLEAERRYLEVRKKYPNAMLLKP